MNKIIPRIKNYFFLRNALNKDIEIEYWNYFVKLGLKLYSDRKKGGCERNLFAAVIKKYRPKHPYSIQGWWENRKIYEDYFKMPNTIKSIKDVKKNLPVYVTMFRQESVYKGDTPFKYHTVGTFLKKPFTIKLISYKKGRFIQEGNSNPFFNLDEEWHTAFRYATEEEISYYETEKLRVAAVEKEIKQKQEELSKLYSKINNE